ncbi:class II aldolase/adducin family protein [Acidisoma cellulosilyticum]|nr:class II aldolase/adducin family protein [Acidisoma cellulosilyticum]
MAAREKLRDAYIDLSRLGLIFLSAGNISMRWKTGMLISPAGASSKTITPDRIVETQFDGTFFGSIKPSSEWAMHRAIYRSAPEAQAIVHTHSDYCVSMSATQDPLPSFHYMVASFGGADVRCTPYVTFGSPELGDAAVVALQDRNACLLGNHGMICHSSSLDRAVSSALRLETLCRQYIGARQAGRVQMLSAEDMAVAAKKYESYGIY